MIRDLERECYLSWERKGCLTAQRAAELRELFNRHEFPSTYQERDAYERLYAVALVEVAFTTKLLWDENVLTGGHVPSVEEEASDAEAHRQQMLDEDKRNIGPDAYTETKEFKTLVEAFGRRAPRRKSLKYYHPVNAQPISNVSIVFLVASNQIICRPLPNWRQFEDLINQYVTQSSRECMASIGAEFKHRWLHELGHMPGREQGAYKLPEWKAPEQHGNGRR